MHSRVLSVLLGIALGLAILGPGAWGFSTTPGTDDAAGGKFYFVTGTGTATATTTAVTSLGNVTGMGCLP